MCGRACPAVKPFLPREPLGVYAAMAKQESLRLDSSSGGVFSLLAHEVLSCGGVVFGAAFDPSDWHVCHRMVEREDGLSELRGSKYVQSDVGDCYRQAKTALKEGRSVLFSGTPCQCTGLRNVLDAEQGLALGKLLVVDVVCHAVPSPLAWRKYLEKRIASALGERACLKDIKRISFRRKDCGWKRYAMSLESSAGNAYFAVSPEDSFMRGFLAELYSRPSCHNCPCRRLASGSDITLADYWGVGASFPEMDDDKGTSLVLVNTETGAEFFSKVADKVVSVRSDMKHAVVANPSILRTMAPHKNRDRFFCCIDDDFDCLVKRMLRQPLRQNVRAFVGGWLRKVGLLK